MPSPSINCFPSLMWKTWVLTSTSSNSGGMNWTTDGEPGLITSSNTLTLWRLNVVFICILYHHVYLWTSAEWIITWSTSIFHLNNILTRKCTVCLHVALISKCSLPLTCNHTHTHTHWSLCVKPTLKLVMRLNQSFRTGFSLLMNITLFSCGSLTVWAGN